MDGIRGWIGPVRPRSALERADSARFGHEPPLSGSATRRTPGRGSTGRGPPGGTAGLRRARWPDQDRTAWARV